MSSFHMLFDKVNATDRCHAISIPECAGEWDWQSTMTDTEVLEPLKVQQADPRVKRPPMFKVVMLNDDYTPMDFVVEVLMRFFRKSESEAAQMMIEVHNKGSAICGVFPRDIAETKTEQVISFAHKNNHPLQCLVERF